jgi:DICT domain-containing protein
MRSDTTLNQLKALLPAGQLPSSYGVYFKNTLVALCHALEDHILLHCGEDEGLPLVLATFQQGKWYLQEAQRYADIAKCSRHIMIAAMADSGLASHETAQKENVSLIHLDKNDTLVNEWNLIILAPSYAAMLLCHELSPEEYHAHGRPTGDIERKFYGLWTFDRTLVTKAATILIQEISPYNAPLAEELATIQQEIETNSITTKPADLTAVVSRIITYLQTSQQQLITVNRQARELVELEGQARKLNRNLTASKLQAFLRMAQKVDERDASNPVASLQVSALSETLGQIIDLPTLKLRRLRLAGLLFRLGLAEAPIEVFTQTASTLDDASLAFWRDRAVLGAGLLSKMPELEPIKEIVLHQLEYWDGSGKPDGLKEEEITIESRILCLVSYFQEITQPRGKRVALSPSDALEKCQSHSGTRFDPSLVESLTTVVRLTEIGLMQLPQRPTQLPTVWLEETAKTSTSKVVQ